MASLAVLVCLTGLEKLQLNIKFITTLLSHRRALLKRCGNVLTKNIFFLLGGVVYEDPWLAGGHNGLSNSEDPELLQAPFERVAELRSFMNEIGLAETPIVMAEVWHLKLGTLV